MKLTILEDLMNGKNRLRLLCSLIRSQLKEISVSTKLIDNPQGSRFKICNNMPKISLNYEYSHHHFTKVMIDSQCNQKMKCFWFIYQW